VGIDAEVLAQGSHFVGKADFERVIAVGKILDHFGHRNGRLVELAGSVLVKFSQRREMLAITGSEDRVGRIEEIGDSTAFAHELRVIAKGKIASAFPTALFFQDGEHDGLGGTGQHGAAKNEDVRRFLSAKGGPISPATLSMWLRSSLPFFRLGVPTQTKDTSELSTAAVASVVARSRPVLWASATISVMRASMIGVRPEPIISTLARLTSTPITLCPIEAKQAAETEPTYPKPKMLTDKPKRILLVIEYMGATWWN